MHECISDGIYQNVGSSINTWYINWGKNKIVRGFYHPHKKKTSWSANKILRKKKDKYTPIQSVEGDHYYAREDKLLLPKIDWGNPIEALKNSKKYKTKW